MQYFQATKLSWPKLQAKIVHMESKIILPNSGVNIFLWEWKLCPYVIKKIENFAQVKFEMAKKILVYLWNFGLKESLCNKIADKIKSSSVQITISSSSYDVYC